MSSSLTHDADQLTTRHVTSRHVRQPTKQLLFEHNITMERIRAIH